MVKWWKEVTVCREHNFYLLSLDDIVLLVVWVTSVMRSACVRLLASDSFYSCSPLFLWVKSNKKKMKKVRSKNRRIWKGVYIKVCIYIYIYIYVCMYVCMYVCVCVCVCVYMCVCVCVGMCALPGHIFEFGLSVLLSECSIDERDVTEP